MTLLFFRKTVLAHEAEPISTEFALPFERGTGNQKYLYEYEKGSFGASQHTIPELELELGVADRWQLNLGFPFSRVKKGENERPVWAGGKLEFGTGFLLFGGERKSYAVSLQGAVEVPTGNRRLFGDTPGLGAGLFVDRSVGRRIRLHSNFSWQVTVGNAQERVFEYRNAAVWFASRRWLPALELLGATHTNSGETEFSVQPELIFRPRSQLELKVELPLGLTSHTPDIGVRAQMSILWGDLH